ncbi:(2Fe-2S)-binding protein [Paenibacillus pasadenensis]|uniref:(2Fe-2S)-binding protein n=1 Tax=Paenibacillus pasadenensis TaxID=217090 RepID=UPI00203C1E1E|nr:(2Fe-2S)-binding protein [Paenibacillus pasadenensis]MCM3750294.1 (2Fe-2S)-binding protein [Paenibacillus pasadenensis]
MDQALKDMLHGKIGLLSDAPEGVQVQASLQEMADRPETALQFLQRYAELIPSCSIEPAATYVPSWIRGLVGTVHYLTASGTGSASMRPEDWQFVLYKAEEASYASIGFICTSIQAFPSPVKATALDRQKALEMLYGSLLAPLFRSLAEGAGVRANELWRLAASNLQYVKSYFLEAAADDAELYEALSEDFAYVLVDMPGEVVGERRNPLAIRFTLVDSPYEPGTQIPLRGGCCLAFKTEYAKYCYNCPRLKPQERSRMYDEICAQKSG